MEEEIDAVKEFLIREKWWLGELNNEIAERTFKEEAQNITDKEGVCCPVLVAPLSTSKVHLLVSDESDVMLEKPRLQSNRIREWQEFQKKHLIQLDHEEELKKLALREQAKKDIENYMEKERKKIAQKKTTYRKNDMIIFETSTKFEWQRVVELCDINNKTHITGKDKSRLRSIYFELKKNSK